VDGPDRAEQLEERLGAVTTAIFAMSSWDNITGLWGWALAVCAAAMGCGRIGFDVNGGDARGGDARGSDSPVDAVPLSLCATSGFVMCDGFESGMTANPPWSTSAGVTVDAEHVYRGALAVHASTPVLTATQFLDSFLIDNNNRATLAASTAYLRAFLYLTSTSATTFTLVRVDPVSNAANQIVDVDVASGQLVVQIDSVSMTSTGAAMPTDRWACLELSALGSTTTTSNDAQLVLWLDGAQIADVTSFNLSPSQ
jgi:hypothetical protein